MLPTRADPWDERPEGFQSWKVKCVCFVLDSVGWFMVSGHTIFDTYTITKKLPCPGNSRRNAKFKSPLWEDFVFSSTHYIVLSQDWWASSNASWSGIIGEISLSKKRQTSFIAHFVSCIKYIGLCCANGAKKTIITSNNAISNIK